MNNSFWLPYFLGVIVGVIAAVVHVNVKHDSNCNPRLCECDPGITLKMKTGEVLEVLPDGSLLCDGVTIHAG